MALERVWTPTENYHGGGTKRLIIIHSMEGFTGQNGAFDCAKYFQTDCGASSQVCIDNNRGKVWECVSRYNASWTQCGYNGEAVSAEQSGYASWSRDYWLSNRENELRNTADWIAEESRILGIPIKALSSSEAQGGAWGIAHHSQLGSSGCGHSDCGPGYPLDKVIEWAKGGDSPVVPEESEMSSSVKYYNGKTYVAYINPAGRVCMNGGVVDPGSNAKSGVGLDIDQGTGQKIVSYTNADNVICTYEQARDNSEWVWVKRGWDAK